MLICLKFWLFKLNHRESRNSIKVHEIFVTCPQSSQIHTIWKRNSFQMKYGGEKNQHENKWSYFGYLSLICEKSSNYLNAFIVDYHNRNHDLMLSRVLKQNELFEMLNYKGWICMFSPSISSTMIGKKIIEQIWMFCWNINP